MSTQRDLQLPRGAALRSLFAKFRAYVSDGMEPDEIARKLGFAFEAYEAFVAKFYEAESQGIRDRTTEQVYVDYCLAQTRNINDLTRILDEFKDTKQHAAMVAAIRERSNIYDKIISRGQELGFVEKKPERKLVAGVIVAQLTDRQLRAAITEELGGLEALVSSFGGASPEDVSRIVDIDPGPIHLPTPKTKALAAEVPGTKRGRSRVHGGRRVVKT